MKVRLNAYEIEENPSLVAVVKVRLKNGTERGMVFAQLLDEDKKLTKFSKIKNGFYEEV